MEVGIWVGSDWESASHRGNFPIAVLPSRGDRIDVGAGPAAISGIVTEIRHSLGGEHYIDLLLNAE